MNFGRGFPIPKENGIVQNRDSWTSVTPARPIPPRSNLIPVDMQGNQVGKGNWQDLIGMYTDYLQETPNSNGANHNLHSGELVGRDGGHQNRDLGAAERNPISSHYSNSCAQTFRSDPANWNSDLLAGILGMRNNAASAPSVNRSQNQTIHVPDEQSTPNSCNQVGRNWVGSESTSSVHRNQNQAFVSNEQINGYNLQQLPTDGFPVPYWPYYNLNAPPRSEADATSSITNAFTFSPITPDHRNQAENQRSERVNLKAGKSFCREKDAQESSIVAIQGEDTNHHCNELLQNVVDSSSSIVSTTTKANIVSDEGDGQDIDLNKTPQQKTPKRRKHRPKVVKEGKPKRTPKPKTPNIGGSNGNPEGKRKSENNKAAQISETQQANGVGEVHAGEVLQSAGKRKYVRKNGPKNLESHQAVGEVAVPAVEPAVKSCRRALNFDLESVKGDQIQKTTGFQQIKRNQGSNEGFNLNFLPQETEQNTRINSIFGTSPVQKEHQSERNAGASKLESSINRISASNALLCEQSAPTPLAKARDHAVNVIARNMTIRNSIPGQNSWRNGYSQMNQHVYGEGIGQIVSHRNTACTNLDKTMELMPQRNTQSLTKEMPIFDERRGFKRQSCEQMHPSSVNAIGSCFMYQKMLWAAEANNHRDNFGSICSETHKKKKIHNGFHTNITNAPLCPAAVTDSSRQETGKMNHADASSSILQSLNCSIGRDKASNKVIDAVNLTTDNSYFQTMAAQRNLQKQSISSEVRPQTERMLMKSSQGPNQVHDVNSLTAIVNWNQLPTTPPKEPSRSGYLQEIVTGSANVLEKKTARPSSSAQRLHEIDKMLQQHHNNALEDHQQYSTKARGTGRPKKQQFQVSVDEIIYRLEGLNIGGENKNKNQEQRAIVPYRGGSSIIPYEPIKKRKPRPKVDLDPETDRLWRLLMGKEGAEGTEAIDRDKEKWWEEERNVFNGRAESFIARMHMVQGDRRFSRWKGSVVDSVIGVFLTQNVSDHLSSSAFMSLASKFPLRSTATSETCCRDGTSVLVEEPDIQILEPNGSINRHEKIGRQPAYSQSSIVAYESSEHIRHLISGARSVGNDHNRISDEEIFSSQDSFDSFNLQSIDEIRSSSGSNSEAEDQTTGCESNKAPGPTPMGLLQAEKADMYKGFNSHENRSTLLNERSTITCHQSEYAGHCMQNPSLSGVNDLKRSSGFNCSINSDIHLIQESLASSSNFQLKMMRDLRQVGAQCHGMSGQQSISSLSSTASGISEVLHTINRTYQQNEKPRLQATPPGQYEFLNKHPSLRQNLQPEPQIGYSRHFINSQQQERSKAFQQVRTVAAEPVGPFETLARMQTAARNQDSPDHKFIGKTVNNEDRISIVDKQNCFETSAGEANSKEQNQYSHEPIRVSTNIMKPKKGKAEEFDWDSLRKQARPNGELRQRSNNALDSLDYETLRCADVNKISDAIRERGMNNMLADRIKDFLNRLVRDHGSIDLEWLRDVPPDKAKDYLLSIRGLGLKSVECVRLLTLHHLAFPVDTNVGRIAVRLGWVPLQPLPESLQLHLLELYPVLESIQKYLWPRLCKLDQRTLYELHYQMITFGKVFCTKSKPNCNACPMRAECRHFASAFASARLALPGPEEKSIVSSDVPIATHRNPSLVIKPMALPPADNINKDDVGLFHRKFEPIIEEPTTPEQETTEVSETDIEDSFYEDPDEIPTIKLNMEEFTLNLQNLMQDNMQLQGDMSKALVALNPEAASIPAPKLKNVSRLRTEHQVYELPDSHPLLNGLDKREPDDPSPYLLAIWTPGETAESIQPPERTCQAGRAGNLCNDITCFSCNSIREANSQTVRGTVLIPCRTAMRGSFPLNGTYFQVNEMFADHDSSLNPIDVPRAWLWRLDRRTVYFGTSVSTIFKGLSTKEIQECFWKGFVCVRGFDQKTRAPRPLMARLHFPASKMVKTKNEAK